MHTHVSILREKYCAWERIMDDKINPLFETFTKKGTFLYKLFATTILVSIISIWVYRATQLPPFTVSGGWRLRWIGMFVAELMLGLYWIMTQSVRWNPTYRRTFKQRLTQRFGFNHFFFTSLSFIFVWTSIV